MTIASLRQRGSSVRAIVRTLGRSPGSISRELARNSSPELGYTSAPAQALSVQRREAARLPAKLDPDGVTWGLVLTLLNWKYSPQQIVGTLKRVFPNDPSRQVSNETSPSTPPSMLSRVASCAVN